MSENNPMPSSEYVLRVNHVAKTYDEGGLRTEVLSDVSFSLKRGETMAIVGASGSGKSTLLHILGGLDTLNSGEIWIDSQFNEVRACWLMNALSEAQKGQLRNRAFGFIYQFHHLLPEFTALENVCMPLLIRGTAIAEAQRAAAALLERVGLGARAQHKPSELSGGERQRCAVARALVTKPACVLGDEPTGNLDEGNAAQVYALMLELNREIGTSFILVTHDTRLAARMDRTLVLHNGALQESLKA